jgi:hypothetical protein
MLECLFRKLDEAEATCTELSQKGALLETAPCFWRAAADLYQGPACVGQASAALNNNGPLGRSRRIRRARQCHRRLVRLRHLSEANFGAKALLLGAEIMASRGSTFDRGLLQYEAAVAAARKAEAWGDAALACERLFSALHAKGGTDEALLYLNQASKYDMLWGATAKVTELQSSIQESARFDS